MAGAMRNWRKRGDRVCEGENKREKGRERRASAFELEKGLAPNPVRPPNSFTAYVAAFLTLIRFSREW